MLINICAAWIGFLMGCAAGAVPGLFFYRKDWLGGYYEGGWSYNPHWTAEVKELPDHPITRGVEPFSIADEWYYNMRFLEGMEGVTPVLSAVPPAEIRQRESRHDDDPAAAAARLKMAEHLAWARERPDGGRGFGFTGGHFHWNWAHDDFRTLVLNGIAWVAKVDIPPDGVPSETPTMEQLEANQDFPPKKNFDRRQVLEQIQQWSK